MILPIKSSKQASEEAKKVIDEGRTGEQLGLKTRFKKLDKALLGGWRFNNQIILAGMSGGGKSFMLNMLRKDFANKELNKNFNKPFKQLHFSFEMSASDEVIRSASSDTKTSYGDLISAYSILNEFKYQDVIAQLKLYEELNIDYVEVSGTINDISETIDDYQRKYPQHDLIISIDHTLLTDYNNEKDEVSLVTNLSKMMLGKRKRINSMNILVSQLNADIEETQRIMNSDLHYPKKKDLHGSKAVYRDCDICLVVHTPEKLGITSYGRAEYDTRDKVFNHILKDRKGGASGVIEMLQDYANGNLIELDENEIM